MLQWQREIGELIHLKSMNDCMKANCLSQLKNVAAASGVDFADIPFSEGVEHCTIGEIKVFRFMCGKKSRLSDCIHKSATKGCVAAQVTRKSGEEAKARPASRASPACRQ